MKMHEESIRGTAEQHDIDPERAEEILNKELVELWKKNGYEVKEMVKAAMDKYEGDEQVLALRFIGFREGRTWMQSQIDHRRTELVEINQKLKQRQVQALEQIAGKGITVTVRKEGVKTKPKE